MRSRARLQRVPLAARDCARARRSQGVAAAHCIASRAWLAPFELTCLIAGAVAGFVWFEQVRALTGAAFLRGDAAEYWTIARTFTSFSQALGFAGGRSVGFPFFLFALMRGFIAWHGSYDFVGYLNFCAYVMGGVHVACAIAFFAALRAAWRLQHERVLRAPLLAALLAYPGLIAHTAVLLTDTFAADLLMLGAAALLFTPRSRAANLACGVASGALFGAATLCRPTYLPAFGLACVFACLPAGIRVCIRARLQRLRAVGALLRRRPPISPRATRLLAALATSGVLLALATVPCAARYHRACLADPTIIPRLVPPSLRIGLDSPRVYWSRFALGSECNASCAGCVAFRDETLSQTWATSCQIDEARFAYGFPACIANHPGLALLYVGKKAIGLFDSYAYHDYAVDITPAWARLWSRPFGALAFAGLVAACGLLVLRGRNLPPEDLLFIALVLGQTAAHSFGHIEPRYGYGAVPFALYALALVHRELHMRPLWLRAGCFCGLAGAALLFLAQTHVWDTQDAVLHRIEASAVGRAAPRETLRYSADG